MFQPTNQVFVQVKHQDSMSLDQGVNEDPNPGLEPLRLVIQVARQAVHQAVNHASVLVKHKRE